MRSPSSSHARTPQVGRPDLRGRNRDKVTTGQSTGSQGPDPTRPSSAWLLVAELDFDDMASLRNAFQSPEGQATAADVAVLAAGASAHSMVYELEDVY